MSAIKLHISTPEKIFFNNDAESVVLTAMGGELGVLPGHLPMAAALETGPIKMLVNGEWMTAALSGGFALVKGDEIVVLADTAEWPEDIEVSRALEAKQRAEERLRMKRSGVEYAQSMAALHRALTRLSLAKR